MNDVDTIRKELGRAMIHFNTEENAAALAALDRVELRLLAVEHFEQRIAELQKKLSRWADYPYEL